MLDELEQASRIFGGLSGENERHTRITRGQLCESSDEKAVVLVVTKVGHGQNIACGYSEAAQ
jgi:hypothetical protein